MARPASFTLTSTESGAPRAARHRFAFVDGLRGIAALGVVLLHVVQPRLKSVWPQGARLTSYGYLGVLVFFVISGFVISHSMEGVWTTPRTAARFLWRRMARLDPPYWISIVLVLVVAKASAIALRSGETFVLPAPSTLAANAFYLQYLLGYDSMADIYWTLAFEIQFYLLLTALTALEQRLARHIRPLLAAAIAHGPLLVYSILVATQLLPLARGTCFAYWFAFAAGMGAQRFLAGRGSLPVAIGVVAALLVAFFQRSPSGVVVALTALAIAAGHARGQLDVWLSSRPFRYLGRISYSLYLVHPTIGARTGNLAGHLLRPGNAQDLVVAAVGVLASFLAADVFWRLVEKPSIQLSRWVAGRTPSAAPAVRPT
jgi:peptidoglycan/LPS O-acetylase OafA/YrhL